MTVAVHDKSDEEVQSATKTGRPPKNRIKNATVAHKIYKRLFNASLKSAIVRAKIEGQIDGNPPFSEIEKRRLGLEWEANVNFRESAATINLNTATIWEMFTGVEALVDLTFLGNDPQAPDNDWHRIVAEEFTSTMNDWEDFNYNVMLKISQMLKHGVGPTFWRDEDDWRSQSVKSANVLVPVKSKCTLGGLKFCFVRDEIDVIDLYEAIEDEERAKEEGWNVAECRRVIIKLYKDGQINDNEEWMSSAWESLQTQIRAHDDPSDKEFDGIRIVHVLSQEAAPDSGVTHSIIFEQEERKEWMFNMPERFDSMENAMHFMFFNVGDGYYKGVKGLAHEIYATNDISNRLVNTMINGGMIGSGLVLQPKSASDDMGLNLARFGNSVTVIPADVDAVQTSFTPPIANLISLRDVIQTIQNNNVGIYKNLSENVNQPERTLGEVQIEQANDVKFQTVQAAWFYVQWEKWLKETFRRLMNENYSSTSGGYEAHRNFVQRCVDRGVPERFMKVKYWKVSAMRSIGMGSLSMKLQITNDMMKTIPGLDEAGRTNVNREWYGARVGWRNVDRFVPSMSRNDIPSLHTHLAQFENNDMMSGQDALVAADDVHVIHLKTHLALCTSVLQRYQQGGGGDPTKDADLIMRLIDHMHRHLQFLSQDNSRKELVKQFAEAVGKVAEAAKGILVMRDQILKARQAEQEQAQKLIQEAQEIVNKQEYELEKYKIDKHHEVEMYEVQRKNESQMARTEAVIYAKMRQMIEESRREDSKAIAEIVREGMKADAEARRKPAKETKEG